MTSLGVTAFETLYQAMPDARCQVRVGTKVYVRALTSGLSRDRDATDYGSLDRMVGTTVRVPIADEDPAYPLAIGTVIEVSHVAAEGWIKSRIVGRRSAAGIIALTLEHPFE